VTSLKQDGSSFSYAVGSHQGQPVMTLNVASPGRYRVSATDAPDIGADLAVGGSVGRAFVGVFLPAIPLIFLGILGLVVLPIVRSRRARSLQRWHALGGSAG
jgi:hypothetical protein